MKVYLCYQLTSLDVQGTVVLGKSRVELPPHYRLMQHKDTIMPKIGSYLDPLPGVSISVKESVQLH